ncbi:MAG: hypothetical protein ISS45_09870 [Candidatus Omnitrophica bacterium]|nr:hypothetical protein [Candidatus Omnitrophota bacterium]
MKRIIAGLLCFVLLGCASFSGYEKIQYSKLQLKLQKTGLPELEEKKPFLAGALNLLPGFGNAYLEQWGPFIGNLLLWPYSVLWAIPQATMDANVINKKETLLYYTHGLGEDELNKKYLEWEIEHKEAELEQEKLRKKLGDFDKN